MSVANADNWFSFWIRHRDRLTCQRCLRRFILAELDCSHLWPGRHRAVRWDPDNAAAMCRDCHRYLEAHPEEHKAIFRARLGEERFAALQRRKAGTAKYQDLDAIALEFREKAAALGAFRGRGPALSTFQPGPVA